MFLEDNKGGEGDAKKQKNKQILGKEVIKRWVQESGTQEEP